MVNPFEPIDTRLNNLEALTLEILQNLRNKALSTPDDDKVAPLSVEAAAQLLGISKQTVYQNIEKIPHRKRFGRLYFFRSELLDYLDTGEGVRA